MTPLLPDMRIQVGGLAVDRLTEAETVSRVMTSLDSGVGGWIVTLNVDICRGAHRDAELCELVAGASLAVPDGMPVVWASRALGTPLPERVTGASLIDTLSAAAAASGKSVYVLGGPAGTAEAAASVLASRYPGLAVAGHDSPPFGFETDPEALALVRDRVQAARPDIVFVGLGFPKQENLIRFLEPWLPTTWFVACGAAIPFTAGALARAPEWMQRSGLEWLFRLGREPKRLFSRYILHDLPFAAILLSGVLVHRLIGRAAPVALPRLPGVLQTSAATSVSQIRPTGPQTRSQSDQPDGIEPVAAQTRPAA